MQMAALSDKTFHLKWNNHLQNLSQLFATIYSSSALADVTLSCRDGTLKAHKLVLSACSPYFEQIFKDNPCKHPVVILKGIPFMEISLLVEFMYKGSVDVQEMDLQSLMHTASELEIRGLAYEARDNTNLLNVNLEYAGFSGHPSTHTAVSAAVHPAAQSSVQATVSTQQTFTASRTDVERLKQIHMYQQQMMRAEEIRRRRRDENPSAHTAVNNILAAAAREMEEARNATRGERVPAGIQTEFDQATTTTTTTTPDSRQSIDDDRPRKRASIMSPDDERLKAKKKLMSVRFQDDVNRIERPNKDPSPGEANASNECSYSKKNEISGGIKVVQLSTLQQKPMNNENNDDSDERQGSKVDDDEETDSSGSMSDTAANDSTDGRPHVCDVCDLRFQRSSHLTRHRLTHTGERPFTCGGCGRSFARSDKLRVHTKICERDDPTVDMANDAPNKRENSSEVMSGMVRSTHRESGHLVFTASGDVMLPPRGSSAAAVPAVTASAGSAAANPHIINSTLEPVQNELTPSDLVDPPRRGRGRPRKTPLPLTPKIKKRRGRPPKTSLDMEGCVLTSGQVMPSPQSMVQLSPAGHQLLMKKKRGRPPKNYLLPDMRPGMDMAIQMQYGLPAEMRKLYARPNENYNATNLPFGDFSYLTEMMFNPLAYSYGVAGGDSERGSEDTVKQEPGNDRAIDVFDSSTDEDDHNKVEPEENVPPVAMETQIMTVGDCQIVKLPPNGENNEGAEEEVVQNSTPGSVTITPITTVGDCTIRPVENT